MVGKKNIRSYEVSIWTLQDSFITVLKPLNLEHKGAIQNGKITLQDDGENRISFSIPMYIREKGEFVENPLWYNTEDGNLIANLRKLKVIFNKKTVDERVFEFIITKVTEKHEDFEKTCEVEGESLAFNELGKQGYKISLSKEDLDNEIKDLNETVGIDDVVHTIYIKNNLNYWVDKVLAGTNWSYSIQMDWSIVDGVIDQYEEGATRYSDLTEEQRATLNFNRESNGLRRHDRIYEDAYVSSWDISNNTLIPAAVVKSTEKLRMVEGEESNRYNLLQSIAEAFEVYTKYKYYYDNNYHIVDREVIFYNNFLDEDNTIDLTYDYDTQSISRELDATDIVTKMYVKTLDDESYPSGLASIADTNANKTGEDYILNFDYLYDIKTINDEQYAAIKIFEKDIANLNKQIIPLDTSIIKLEEELFNVEIARDNAKSMMEEAEKNITFITEQLKAISEDSNNETIVVVKENPAFIFLSKQENNYLGKFGSQFSGIIPGTVEVYSNSACTSAVSFTQQIKDNMVQSLTFTNSIGTNITSGYLYATFSYKPALEKEKLRDNYISLRNNNQTIYNNNLEIINGTNPTKVNGTKKELGLTNYIQAQKQKRKLLYEQKQALIANFENMMGPALREGNWQPEDEYVGYGDQYDENVQPSYTSTPISTESGKLKFIWDKELFDEEEKNYYEYGINQQKVYYPCIDLTKINSNIFEKLKEEEFRNGLSFVYKDLNETNPYLLPQGTNCKFAFIQPTSGGDIIPVLMITNLYNETNITNNTTAQITMEELKENLTCYIAYVTDISVLLNTITVNNSTIFSVPPEAWIDYPNNYNIVYPRLEIQSDLLKTGENELLLNIYREKTNPTGQGTVYTYINKLKEFTDYSLFSKNEKKYITIKPEVLLAGKIGEAKIKINYCLANTALQIYLDAIEVMKENAYPKVSYTINQLFSPKLFYNTYDRLGQLAHINDAKLKFKNVMGYISAVELDLDKPWEDSITIQNYKNKFEDLFSTIVAQTEDMKKNAYRINAAANAFSANGLLTAEVTPESLLKSARVLNNLIKNNADVITAKAVGEAAKNKAALASTDAYRIMHGEVGLAFKGNKIDSVVLNQDKGLIVAGKTGTTNVFFQLDNAEMGFFKGTPGTFNETNPAARPVPQLYYENGNLTLSGVMYAASGWFGGENGWIIGSDELSSDTTTTIATGLGGLLYSANGKAIFTSKGGGTSKEDPMIILTKTGFSLDKQNAALLFDGTNLYINGTITSTAGNIGGWYIGENYIGSGDTRAQSIVGMSNYNNENSYAFWAGAEGVDSTDQDQITVHSPKFSVTKNGSLTSTKGSIGGWYIGSDYLGNASILANSSIGFHTNTGDNIVLWAGNKTRASAPFRVTANGALTSTSGKIANWEISNYQLNSGSGTTYVALNSGASNVTGGSTYAIWAGNTTATSAPFSVTKAGVLKATDAIISGDITATSGTFTGAINARSGTIGQENAPKITIGSSGNTSTSISWIYSGNKSTLTSDTLDGFYLGTNGLALGKGLFKVTDSGVLTAKSGTIGGWTLVANRLHSGSGDNYVALDSDTSNINYAIWAGAESPVNAKFSVTREGALTATSGSIGGWTIGSNFIGNGSTRRGDTNPSTVGMSCLEGNTAFVFWAGGQLTDGSDPITSIPFYVRANGSLCASKGYIGGWTISNSAIYKNTNSPTSTMAGIYLGTDAIRAYSSSTKYVHIEEGKITAKNADISGVLTAGAGSKIGGWSLDANKMYSGSTNTYVALDSGTSGETYAIWAGAATAATAPFRVTKGGELTSTSLTVGTGNNTLTYDGTTLTVKGTVTANSGYIGGSSGWIIKSQQIYSGTAELVADNNITLSTKDIPKTINGSALTNLRLIIGSHFGVTATGALYASNAILSGSLTSGSDFSVTSEGVLTAKKGSIGNWTIGDNYIGTGTTRGNSEVGISNYTTGNNDDTKLAFWAGNKETSIDSSKIPFSVTRGGLLRASKVNITGGTFNIKLSKSISIANPEDEANPITKTYNGELSINEGHKYIYDTLDISDMPCPLFIKDKTFTEGYEYMYYCDGRLRFSDSNNGLYNTEIASWGIETPRLYTKYTSIRNNYVSISYGDGGIEMVSGKKIVGLRTNSIAWDDSWGNDDVVREASWIICKKVNSQDVYIDGDVYVRNAAGTGWKKISG